MRWVKLLWPAVARACLNQLALFSHLLEALTPCWMPQADNEFVELLARIRSGDCPRDKLSHLLRVRGGRLS